MSHDPHAVTRGEINSHVHEIAMLRRRMTKLESALAAITSNQLAEFAKFNMAALLGKDGGLVFDKHGMPEYAAVAVTAAQALVDELEARG